MTVESGFPLILNFATLYLSKTKSAADEALYPL
jgi:hypothetical protein